MYREVKLIKIGDWELYYREMGVSQFGLISQALIEAQRVSSKKELTDEEIYKDALYTLTGIGGSTEMEKLALVGQLFIVPAASDYLHRLFAECFPGLEDINDLTDERKGLLLNYLFELFSKKTLESMQKAQALQKKIIQY